MFWSLVLAARAADVTVSPGDDLNALTSSLLPGDTVSFNGGVYPLDGTLYWSGMGTAEAPIVFKPVGNAEVVLQKQGGGWVTQITDSAYIEVRGLTFEGGKNYAYDQPSGLYVANSMSLTLTNLTVRNVWGDALRIDGNTRDLQVDHNELSTTNGQGISIGCWDGSCWMQDSVVEFNLVHDVGDDGLYLRTGTQGSFFRHNVLFNIGDTAIVAQSPGPGGAQNQIFGNAAWAVGGDGIYIEGASLVQNNILFDIGDEGIQVQAPGEEILTDVQISHNTVSDTIGWGAYLDDWYNGVNLVFANNALANPTGYGLYWDDLREDDAYDAGYDPNYPDTTNFLSSNVVTGLVDGFDLAQRPTFVIPGGGVGDFVAPANFDFYPSFGSQLRNAGDPNGNAYIPDRDFNGTARDGASPDVGAYEYDGEGNPGWVLQERFKEYAETDGRDGEKLRAGCCGGGQSEATAALMVLPFGLLSALRRRWRA